jgi:hypothetical protein
MGTEIEEERERVTDCTSVETFFSDVVLDLLDCETSG